MTIRKGQDWGREATVPDDAVIAGSNAELRTIVHAARSSGIDLPRVLVEGGDLGRTLGRGGGRSTALTTRGFVIDIVRAEIDERAPEWFVAHFVARSFAWSRVFAACNVQWLGAWNAAPRGHPNDGKIEVIEARLSIADRLKVRRRITTGAHLPHPGIKVRQREELSAELPARSRLFLDGQPVRSGRMVRITVESDALEVFV